MLNLKNLVATVLLTCVAAVSMAQAPAAPKKGVSHPSATAHKHGGHAAKPKHLKTKAHAKKHHHVRHHAKKHHKGAVVNKA
ncbi:hypothetical protein [Rhodoferax sp.]|uniref:hypothetical protein n=1 Tax=Rhodoferax sp. TaxID=50421 RepID=UPI00283D37CC|nr:hypothetical protein [Rhodoferax sp.]MDR3369181.1 hypothetical protein [Rhodoferax sp.]